MKLRMTVVASWIAAVAGCGGGSDPAPEVAGMYVIEHHTESRADPGAGTPATCAGEGAQVAAQPNLLLTLNTEPFEEVTWALCDSTDPSTCVEDFYSFENIDGHWVIGAATSASYSGGGCSLFHAEGGVELQADGKVRVEVKEWGDFRTIPESECTLELAESFSDETTCELHVVVVGAPAQ